MKIDNRLIIAGLCAAIVLILVFRGGNGDNKDRIKELEQTNELIQEERDSLARLNVDLRKENEDLTIIIEDRDNKLIDEREAKRRQRNAYEKYIKGLRLDTPAELDSAFNQLWPDTTREGRNLGS